jgi:prepilin-type N-terminal cleavage/methylation domain-containing protein
MSTCRPASGDFDIISYGADGVPGGENENRDITNWDIWNDGNAASGYTLLELIVVMALIGIVFFFAIPRFEGSFSLTTPSRVPAGLIGKLQALREEAWRTRRCSAAYRSDTGRLWETSRP